MIKVQGQAGFVSCPRPVRNSPNPIHQSPDLSSDLSDARAKTKCPYPNITYHHHPFLPLPLLTDSVSGIHSLIVIWTIVIQRFLKIYGQVTTMNKYFALLHICIQICS